MEVLKRCTVCQVDKPLNEFNRQAANKDGLRYDCKECCAARNVERYTLKKAVIVDKVKNWQAANPEKIKAHKAKYYQKSKSAI